MEQNEGVNGKIALPLTAAQMFSAKLPVVVGNRTLLLVADGALAWSLGLLL